ncbi:MAG: exonuclease domain-containing protein [Spirochaetota bacterium]
MSPAEDGVVFAFVMVDVEADGPIPADYSMLSLGAVLVAEPLDRTFYAELAPVSDRWDERAIAVGGFTREQSLEFEDPEAVMRRFGQWLHTLPGTPVFVSDNNGFDWQFVNWYFHHFLGDNPFGHGSHSLSSLFQGATRNMHASFKHLRSTKHTHNALDDAMGNAEALLAIFTEMSFDV